ncbi:hypothetical protein [Luteibacter jiangsuensis]
MKSTINVLLVCLLGLSGTALAKNGDPVPGTYLMARSGAANTDKNYEGEDRDINNKLEQVSALCKELKPADVDAESVKKFMKSDKTRNWGDGPTWWISRVSTATGLGAKVVEDAQPGNPNHCLISGLKVSQIKGIWTESPEP